MMWEETHEDKLVAKIKKAIAGIHTNNTDPSNLVAYLAEKIRDSGMQSQIHPCFSERSWTHENGRTCSVATSRPRTSTASISSPRERAPMPS